MKIKWLINPFERIAGWQALLIGVVVMALTAVIGKINNVAFYGSLYVNPITPFSFPVAFAIQAVNYIPLFLTMWLAGVYFSKSKIRAIDVAGTMALTRIPMLLLSVVCFLPITPASLYDMTRMIVFLLFCIPIIIWIVALMYNAYSVSCNLKGSRAILSFIGALFVAEIISRIVLVLLVGSLVTGVPIKNLIKSEPKENIEVMDVDSLTIRQKAENVVKAFEQGDFNAITVYFDENMKNRLQSSGLQMGWIQANMTYGKFKKADIDNLEETRVDVYDVIEVPFIFENEKLKLRLAFNSDGKIGGLFFLPIN